MSLSATECNWFCQGQSIAPRQASSVGDRGCITVKLYSGYKGDAVCVLREKVVLVRLEKRTI